METVRERVQKLLEEGNTQSEVAKRLGISRQLVFTIKERYEETGSHENREGRGRKRNIRTEDCIRKVKTKLDEKSSKSTRKLSRELNISRSSVQRIIKDDLGLTSYKKSKVYSLNEDKMFTREEVCRDLVKNFRNGEHKRALFTDEKYFVMQQSYNAQNDRVWSLSRPELKDRIIQQNKRSKSIMVWAGVTYNGKAPLVFFKAGEKMTGKVYKNMLEKKILPWSKKHFKDEVWTYLQDSAPSHVTKDVRKWILNNFPDFVTPEMWPSYSPDLNPMDYSIWGILTNEVGKKEHSSIKDLKASIRKEWKKLSLDVIKSAIDEFPLRLKNCIKAKGGHFENK